MTDSRPVGKIALPPCDGREASRRTASLESCPVPVEGSVLAELCIHIANVFYLVSFLLPGHALAAHA